MDSRLKGGIFLFLALLAVLNLIGHSLGKIEPLAFWIILGLIGVSGFALKRVHF